MAKKKKYPKRPKRSASLATWQRYKDRVAEVSKYNKALEEKPKKINSIIAQVEKMKH